MKKPIIILLGAAIGIGGSIALRQTLTKTPIRVEMPVDAATKQKRDEEERRKIAWRIVAPRIEIAQEEALKALETRTQQVSDFFIERQKRVPAYAQRVLSLRSKWELGKSKIPGVDKDAHTRFLRDEFSAIVFSEAELSQTVTGAAEDYVRDIQAIENALLVKIRADLTDMPECAVVLPDLKTEKLFHDRFASVVAGFSEKTGNDAKIDMGRLVGSEIATAITIRIGLAVAARFGASTAILGTGAAAGVETFGVSVVVGIIVDQIAGWIIGWYYKPEIEIGEKLNAELGGLSILIVSGDEKTRGLKQELGALAEQRKLVREAALREMILQPGISR
jgi:hypothetical protein